MIRLIETDYFAAQERERLDEIEAERAEKFDRFVGRADAVVTDPIVEFDAYVADRRWRVSVPLSRLGGMVALCGWTLANAIRERYAGDARVMDELNRLQSLSALDVPGMAFFYRYANQVDNSK